MKRKIAVDFDGVIHSYQEGWKDGSIYGHLIPGTKESLGELDKEFEVVIYTTREDHASVWEFLRANQIDHLVAEVTSEKPRAIAYIDDRAIRFVDWLQVMKFVREDLR